MGGFADVLAGRVRQGATLLDRVEPGWYRRIATDRLAMESCDRCILGQLHGDFRGGFRAITRTLPSRNLYSAAIHGFTLFDEEQCPDQSLGMYQPEPLARFAALADAWRAEIRRRMEAAP